MTFQTWSRYCSTDHIDASSDHQCFVSSENIYTSEPRLSWQQTQATFRIQTFLLQLSINNLFNDFKVNFSL